MFSPPSTFGLDDPTAMFTEAERRLTTLSALYIFPTDNVEKALFFPYNTPQKSASGSGVTLSRHLGPFPRVAASYRRDR